MFTFLASYPKSGNTWLRLFLGAYLHGGRIDINRLPREVSNSDLKDYIYQSVAPKPLCDMDPYAVLMLRGAALQHLDVIKGSELTKTHHALWSVEGYPLIPRRMTRKAIYIIRDPRDVAISFSRHLDQSVDEVIDLMGKPQAVLSKSHNSTLCHILGSWSLHVDSWMKAKFPVHAVKYETLLARPKPTFRQILEFLGWQVDEALLDASIEATRLENMKEQEEAHGFVEARNGRFFGGGGSLTPGQAARIEADHGEVMSAMGYLMQAAANG